MMKNKLALKNNKLTISNLFTCLRILLVPCIVHAMVMHAWYNAFIFFTIAALTDVLDGTLARFLQEETTVGAYLDPIADKLLLISCYTTLAFVESPLFKIPLWFVIFVLGKELILMVGAFYFSAIVQTVAIRPSLLSKITTLVQVFFIWLLFACSFFHWPSAHSIYGCLVIIVILMMATLAHYAWIAYKEVENSWLKKS